LKLDYADVEVVQAMHMLTILLLAILIHALPAAEMHFVVCLTILNPPTPDSHNRRQCSRLRSRSLLRLRRGLVGLHRLLLSLGSLAGGSVGLPAVRRGPESEVVAQELHDKRAVAVGLLAEAVELRDGVVEGLLGEVAGAVR
jgi:hypothetical protein